MTTEADDLRSYATTGDESAFRRIVERHAAMVQNVALRMTQDRGMAEEITQSVFSILARKARYLGSSGLGGWLHGVAAAECRNARRKAARRHHLHQQFSETMTREPEYRTSSWDEIFPELDAAVRKLPGDDREMMVLRFFEDRSFREIARVTGRTEAACRKKAQRALERLSDLLRKRGVIAPGAALAGLLTAEGIAPTSTSAAVIASAAIHSVPAASGVSVFFNTLFYMTTQNIIKASIIALVVAAVPIALLLKPEPLPRIVSTAPANAGDPTATTNEAHGPTAAKSRATGKQGAINWKEIGQKLDKANDFARFVSWKKLESSLKDLSVQELKDGLEKVLTEDLTPGTKNGLRILLANQLATLDPMAVLERFPQDHEKDLSYQLTAGIRELAAKDFTAAKQWMDTQIAEGRFQKTYPGSDDPAQLNLFLGAMIDGAGKQHLAETGKMLTDLPQEQRVEVMSYANDMDLQKVFKQALSYRDTTGDSTLVNSVLDSKFADFKVALNKSKNRSNESIFKLLSEIQDPAERERIHARLKAAESKKITSVPME